MVFAVMRSFSKRAERNSDSNGAMKVIATVWAKGTRARPQKKAIDMMVETDPRMMCSFNAAREGSGCLLAA